jgi:hypothetical protein
MLIRAAGAGSTAATRATGALLGRAMDGRGATARLLACERITGTTWRDRSTGAKSFSPACVPSMAR